MSSAVEQTYLLYGLFDMAEQECAVCADGRERVCPPEKRKKKGMGKEKEKEKGTGGGEQKSESVVDRGKCAALCIS